MIGIIWVDLCKGLKMLKRNGSNKKMIEAFEYTAGYNYTTTANCIVGMPEEDRGLIFDTINFCRQLPSHVEHTGAFIFSPFHGTPLRETAIQKGYLDADTICDVSDKKTSTLDQPQLRREEVEGLSKTFGLYQTLPKSEWKYIKVAEQESPEGHKMFDSLTKIYKNSKIYD